MPDMDAWNAEAIKLILNRAVAWFSCLFQSKGTKGRHRESLVFTKNGRQSQLMIAFDVRRGRDPIQSAATLVTRHSMRESKEHKGQSVFRSDYHAEDTS